MNSTTQQCLDSSLKKLGEEVRELYSDLVKDISSNCRRIEFVSCAPVPCLRVKDIFDIKTNYEVVFSPKLTCDTITNLNSGMSGLILDELGKENIFSQIVFEKFFSLFNHLITKNDKLKDMLAKRAMEEIGKKYKNKYKLIQVKDIFLNFVNRGDGNSIPNICLEIQIERVE